MANKMTHQQVVEKTSHLLIEAGIEQDHAAYLAALYADSPRGVALQGSEITPAATCNIGIIPIG